MKPYYEERNIQIFCGDCREVLPELGIYDLCLTDPPYGINRDGQSSRLKIGTAGGRKNYDFEGWDNRRPSADLFMEIFRSSASQIIWGGNYFVEYLKPKMGWIVWDKIQRIDQSDGELAYTSLDEKLRIYTMSRSELNGDGAVHPTQKPVRLMKWCIGLVPWAKSLLDPFMGSGSSLLAAKDMGLRACGIEIQEKYCEITAKRLSQGVLEL